MNECERTGQVMGARADVDEEHLRECQDCREARAVHSFFRKLAAADDLSPSLPDPQLLILKADLIRAGAELHAEGDRPRWAGVGIWTTIAVIWLVVLTSRLNEIQGILERFALVPSFPGGAATTAVLVAALGGLVAFTVFAVAVHSVLAEL